MFKINNIPNQAVLFMKTSFHIQALFVIYYDLVAGCKIINLELNQSCKDHSKAKEELNMGPNYLAFIS